MNDAYNVEDWMTSKRFISMRRTSVPSGKKDGAVCCMARNSSSRGG